MTSKKNAVFALDLGNKQTKLISEKGEYRLPSYYVDTNEDSSIDASNFFENELDVHNFKIKDGSEKGYTWGNDIDKVAKSSLTGAFDTQAFGLNRYKEEAFKNLVDFAICLLGNDFKESKDSILHVNVVTGLPTEDYSNDKCLEQIKKVIKTQHTVKIDNQDNNVNVVVDKLIVLPQPIGTVFDEMVSNSNETLSKEMVSIVDCGGGTLLIDTLNNLSYSQHDTAQHASGVFTLFNNVIKDINSSRKPNKYEIANIIRNGINSADHKFEYKENRHSILDITDIVNREIDEYTRIVINKIQNTILNIDSVDDIIFTGGGSSILNKEMIKNSFPNALFVKHGEMTNAKGFYSYGLNFF